MPTSFDKYMQAEIDAIRASVGLEEEMDPDLFTQRVMNWIETHAHRFRGEWERRHGAIDALYGSQERSTRGGGRA